MYVKHALAGVLIAGLYISSAWSQTPTVRETPQTVKHFQQTITADELAAHLYFLASDFFEGRETTARGQKMAAWYLASEHKALGLLPLGSDSSSTPNGLHAYMQPYPLIEQRTQGSQLTVYLNNKPLAQSTFSADSLDGLSYLRIAGAEQINSPVIFAGFGIAAASYDDYAALEKANVSIDGKWVLMLDGEPTDATGKSLITGTKEKSAWSTQWWQKYITALRHGKPAGILIISGVQNDRTSFTQKARKYAQALKGVGRLSLPDSKRPNRPRPPLFYLSSHLADALLAPVNQSSKALYQHIVSQQDPFVFALPESLKVHSHITTETREVQAENVVAYIEGSDPLLKDEAVVLSAHFDHVGMDPTLEGDPIFNGADDDGSGTVTLLEIAEAFQEAVKAGYRPRRSIVFLHVSGEEKGLLGSRYYTDFAPRWPLEKTVTNLNIDMIGRYDPSHPTNSKNYVYIIGSRLISEELHQIAEEVNKLTDINLQLDERFNDKNDPNRFYRRSDHWNFGKHQIPFIFFFTGTHEDYHRPGDEPHKIDYERMARIGRLIFGIAWQVANQDHAPPVTGTGFND